MRQLIVVDKLNLGGVTSSLINYLVYASKYQELDLLVFNNSGTDSRIPSAVNVLKAPSLLRIFGESQEQIRKSSLFWALVRSIMVIGSRIFGGHYIRRFLFLFIKELGPYDYAVSYTHDVSWKSLTTGCNDFVAQCVKAKYKGAFVHCDYMHYGGFDKRVMKVYEIFDHIICVSNGCKNSFITCFPLLRDKVEVCENFINIESIKGTISSIPPLYGKKYLFVTVCRIEKEKGIFRIVEIVQKLIKESYCDFEWRLIGDGPQLDELKAFIISNNLHNFITLYGKQDPPYSYMKGATLFVLPSFHEAAPMVFGECRVLKLPVLTTRTTSADELVAERNIGLVCDNSTDGIFYGIKSIMDGKVELPIIDSHTVETTNQIAEKEYWKLIKKIQ